MLCVELLCVAYHQIFVSHFFATDKAIMVFAILFLPLYKFIFCITIKYIHFEFIRFCFVRKLGCFNVYVTYMNIKWKMGKRHDATIFTEVGAFLFYLTFLLLLLFLESNSVMVLLLILFIKYFKKKKLNNNMNSWTLVLLVLLLLFALYFKCDSC